MSPANALKRPSAAANTANRRHTCNPTLNEPDPARGNKSRRCWTKPWRNCAEPTATRWCCGIFERPEFAGSRRRAGRQRGARAKKRVTRALEKLRAFFAQRGISTSTRRHQRSDFRQFRSSRAGGAGQGRLPPWRGQRRGGFDFNPDPRQRSIENYGMDKSKNGNCRGVGIVLLAAGTTTITVKEIQEHQTYPWQDLSAYGNQLDEAPPQVKIVPSKYGVFENAQGMAKFLVVEHPLGIFWRLPMMSLRLTWFSPLARLRGRLILLPTYQLTTQKHCKRRSRGSLASQAEPMFARPMHCCWR